MIGLNKIGLNQVQLNQLYLNTLCACQKSSGGDGFPRLPGDVTRWSFKNLTNEQMSKNPRLEDADGKGRFLTFKNFAWDGMSGCDGYTESLLGDTANWESEIYNGRKMSVFGGDRSRASIIHNQYYFQTYVKISGINDNEGKVRGVYFYILGSPLTEDTLCRTDGIYKIDITGSDKSKVVAIWAYPAKKNEEDYDYPVTIEILPLYPGALVFDGVDDWAGCDNFPILTKEKGYTVVALRSIIDKNIPGYLLSNSAGSNQGAFIFERTIDSLTASFGKSSPITVNYNNPLTYQTTSKYNQKSISVGELLEGGKSLVVGRNSKEGNLYANAAIWELVFLDHDATEEELTKIKDYFVKTYPWLFPDQAWTVTGKTNEDEDRATITNITGNGNDLVLSNFGFIEGSGYNEEGQYAGYLVTDGADDKIASSDFKMGKDFTIVGDWKFIDNKKSSTGLVKGSSFYIYNTMIGLDLYINSGSVKNSLDGIKSINAACSDGRAYDRNWNEILANTGNVVGSGGILEVSSSDGRFDRIAFKNLAIYPRILSKDDCIKAYNYLQTLKAK